MLRRYFQIIVAMSPVLAISITVVQFVTESSLPPELLWYLSNYETILVPDRYAVFEVSTNIPFLIQTSLGILAAVGLILFKSWGRSVFLVYVASELVVTVLAGPHVSTGWTMLMGYIYCMIEGVILALIYFSPIRHMFEIRSSAQVESDSE